MTPSGDFSARAENALHDANLQKALRKFKSQFVEKRAFQVSLMPEFELLREHAAAIKNEVLANLDTWLERYAAAVEAAGGTVHFASDAAA